MRIEDFDYSEDINDIGKWRDHLVGVCSDGKLENFNRVIDKNFSVYVDTKAETSPLIKAIEGKHSEIVDALLDIYERDLEVLATAGFEKALVAFSVDQSEELLRTLISEPSGDAVPVLLKSTLKDKPTIAFLSKKKKSKSDRSIEFAYKLEQRNGLCDINYESRPPCGCPSPNCFYDELSSSALKAAVDGKNDLLVKRLLTIPTINNKEYPRTVLFKSGDSDEINEFISSLEPGAVVKDYSMLEDAFKQRNPAAVVIIMREFMKTKNFAPEKVLELEWFKNIQSSKDANFRLNFICHFKIPFDDFEALTYVEYKDNILHALFEAGEELRNHQIVKRLIELCPQLLIERNSLGRFPIFFLLANLGCGNEGNLELDLDLTTLIFEKMVEQTGDADVIFKQEEIEELLEHLIWGDEGKLFTMKPSDSIAVLQKVFNGKLRLILQQHGMKLLHEILVRMDYRDIEENSKLFLKFLCQQNLLRLDLNEPFNGYNAYQRLLKHCDCATKCVKVFINHQAPDLNSCDSDGITTFMYFCKYCDDNKLIKTLIPNDPECVKKTTTDGRNCLFFIINYKKQESSGELLQILLDAGADPHQVSERGEKPIDHAAVWYDKEAFAKLLLIETEGQASTKQWDPRIREKLKTYFHDDSYLGELWTRFSNYLNVEYENESETFDLFEKILASVTREKCLQVVPLETWRDNLNKKNENGDTLLKVMLTGWSSSKLDAHKCHIEKIFELFYDDMDFSAVNHKKNLIAHAIAGNMAELENLFDSYPKLLQTFNDYAHEEDIYRCSPFSNVYHSNVQSNFQKVIQFVSLENLKQKPEVFREDTMESYVNFAKNLSQFLEKYPNFFIESYHESFLLECVDGIKKVEAFEVLLSRITNANLEKVSKGNSNVLHMLCEGNRTRLIDMAITFLSDEQFVALKEQRDDKGRKPFDLLNDENKANLGECFEGMKS